jgi:hypothetical protein
MATNELFETEKALNDFGLHGIYCDKIPDIRRSRRECRGTKAETVFVYRKCQRRNDTHSEAKEQTVGG